MMNKLIKSTVLSVSLLLAAGTAFWVGSANAVVQPRALSDDLNQAIEQMIVDEMQSSYMYTGMSIYFHRAGFHGMAHWASLRASEELSHFQKQLSFALAREASFSLKGVNPATATFKSPVEAFTAAYNQEKGLSENFKKYYEQATKAQAYDVASHLHWFLNEQIEEEASVSNILHRLEVAGDNAAALLLIDQELAAKK